VDGLWSLDRRLSLFAPRTLRTVPAGEEPLVDAALAGWERFAEVVPVDVGDAISAVHNDPAPLARALLSRGTTLAHGDLWLVNVAFDDRQVVLLDWNLVIAAPGAVDFANFLMGASAVTARREDLLDDIRQAQGGRYDDTALRLALLASLADLGWNKALDATGADDEAIRRREAAELDWWVAQARLALDLGAF
jgi:thiamine kinase-like enzyme